MRQRLFRALTILPAASLLVVLQPGIHPLTAGADPLAPLTKLQQRILSGFASQELTQDNAAATQAPARASSAATDNYFPSGNDGCPVNLGNNIKVNQNCLNITDRDLQGRGQAQNETAVAVDAHHPQNLVATWNDYRRGDANCIGAFSRNGGQTWTDTLPPTGFTRGTAFGGVAREYWQGGGDTSIAWDTQGNAYFACQMFQRGPGTTNNPDFSSSIYVFRSTSNSGASWNFTARPVAELRSPTFIPLLDKPYMTVDDHGGSPFRDRVYVTWTLFSKDGTAVIYEAFSNDYGETFSPPKQVATPSVLCPNSVVGAGNCDSGSFSQPFTAPDGSLYVVYQNFNNPLSDANDNRNQILISRSTDGGATFGAPVKVADWYDLPSCAPYQNGQDFGRACVPEKGSSDKSVFRATNYASGSINPSHPSQVAVTFGSYIGPHSNEANGCVPAGFAPDGNNAYTGVKTAGACKNDILLSVSNDGGASFDGATTDARQLTSVAQAPGQKTTDQWWQWSAFTSDGRLAVSYFDRQYGDDETSGFSDISLSGSEDLHSFGVRRVTSSSMPPPTQFPNSRGHSTFYGDYSGLSAAEKAYPVWMDTRDPDLFVCPGTATPGSPPRLCTSTTAEGIQRNDQDIFTAIVDVPSGGGDEQNGH